VVGAVIGSYQLIQKLGEGGMGVVYLGQHTLLGRRAAIKVLLPALSARPDIVNRFFNEARAVTLISDPGIVQVFDFGYHTDGSAFIVMEFLEGEPLDKRLAKLGRFSVYEALRLCRQIATSLAAAHAQHIVHRDLKPENIFLVRDAEVASGERSKILDFGIAKLSDDHPGKLKTHTGTLMGTPVYMSPEQCRGLAEIDHRSDIYALGCVLFHLITGRPPFMGEGVGDIISAHIRELAPAASSLVAGIAPNVDALLLRCLAKAPADRYPSMTELAAAIGQLLQQVPADAALPYAHGTEPGPMPNVPAAYYSPTPTPPTPPPSYTALAAPTTLGASAGQLPSASRQSARIGRWIAGVLVLGAVGAGLVIVGMRNDGAPRLAATPHEPGSAASVEPPTAPPGPPNAAGASTPDAGELVAAAPTAATPSATSLAAAPAEGAPAKVAQPGAATPVATLEPAKKSSRLREHAHKAPLPSTTQPSPASMPAATRPTTQPSPASTPAATRPTTQPAPTTTPAVTRATTPPPVPPAPASGKCSKADFAAVYDAAVPAPGAVRTALRALKACHDSGAVTDAEFDRYQLALVAKL
jgi:serine/threonine protein kinase